MTEEKKPQDLSTNIPAALSDDELDAAVGGLKSLTSGKWIVTEAYTCDYFHPRDGVDSRYTGTRQCRFCHYMGKENLIVMICNNPANT